MSETNRHKLRVKKRDGTLVPVRVDDITDRLDDMCNVEPVLDYDIDPFKITQTVVEQIHDGISTTEIDSFTADICANLSITHPHYGILSARLVVSDHHKNVSCQTGLLFSEVCEALYNNVDQLGVQNSLISETIYQLTKEKKDEIDSIIDLKRDFLIDFFGFKTLHKGYLLRTRDYKTKETKILETPQHLFLRVALGIHGSDLEKVKETYDLMSLKYFTHATPTLYNAGTPNPQLFSCFLLGEEDSLDGIFKCLKDTAHISKWAGGIGIHISEIRAAGSYIRGTAGKSDGIPPMLKVFNDTARYINQGGRRLGSFAMYLEPWHSDVFEFLDNKRPHGAQETKALDLFYALWVPDLFMKRVSEDSVWSLMCPSECPGLVEAYGEDFEQLYEKYESEKRFKKQIKARELFTRIIETQIETGAPYMCYKDAVNRKNNQKNLGTIRSSNLCAEINEFSNTEKYACCVLASLVLPTFVDENTKIIDHEKLFSVTRVIVRNLDLSIDLNKYPVPETKVSNLSERPIGIGVQGLADVFFKMRVPYDSEEAAKINLEIFETIYFAALTESCSLAKEKGTYESFKDSPFSKGVFQFDMWKEFSGVDLENKLSGRWDWETLRKDVKKHGTRNSLLTALMPTASTSQIMGSAAEAFEPITSNVYSRRTLAGEFSVINKYLTDDLLKLGLWSSKMKNKLMKNRGSVQNIKSIPQEIKDIYKTVWEIKQKVLIDLSADRGLFVDQSQSLNLFFDKPSFSKLYNAHVYGHKIGLKTGSYYIRSKPSINAESFTLNDMDSDDESDEETNNEKIVKNIENSNSLLSELSENKTTSDSIPKEDLADCEMCSA